MASTGGVVPRVFVLDGGFSSQLSCHVVNNVDGSPLWTSRFLQTHAEEIVNTHIDFLCAGADVITTNTYQAWIDGFVKYLDVTAEEGRTFMTRAVEFSKQARDSFLKENSENMLQEKIPLIAGSVGPYGAHLNNASEYSGSYADYTTTETMRDWHIPRIEALIEAGVDLIAFETIPYQKEAEMLVELLKEYPDVKAWLSFSCKDEMSLCYGEDFKMAAIKCWNSNPNQLKAVGVNCCSPLIVSKLLKDINNNKQVRIPLIAYPNSGEKYNQQLGWIERDNCESIESFVYEWLDLGVQYVGGCCRTYATDVSHIRTQVQSWSDKKRFKELHSSIKY